MGFPEGLRRKAHELGFDRVGVCPVLPSRRSVTAYLDWLAAGAHGGMGYMERRDRVARAIDPRRILEGARSIVVVARRYPAAPAGSNNSNVSNNSDVSDIGNNSDSSDVSDILDDPSRGRIAAYAWGPDYHRAMLRPLGALAEWLSEEVAGGISYREYVDTGPVLERDAAVRAGLGFFGRNSMLIDKRAGSSSLLGAIITDAALEPSVVEAPAATCGSCARCLAACPTEAFARERFLVSSRCLSYLTIENKGPIPRALRPAVGNRVFGCDVCSNVCPYTIRFAEKASQDDIAARSSQVAPPLVDLLVLDEAAFRAAFGQTPVSRAKRRGIVRNACVAAGNWGSDRALAALMSLLQDPEPLVRGHAAWALGRIGGRTARRGLDSLLATETDEWVQGDVRATLDELGWGA